MVVIAGTCVPRQVSDRRRHPTSVNSGATSEKRRFSGDLTGAGDGANVCASGQCRASPEARSKTQLVCFVSGTNLRPPNFRKPLVKGRTQSTGIESVRNARRMGRIKS